MLQYVVNNCANFESGKLYTAAPATHRAVILAAAARFCGLGDDIEVCKMSGVLDTELIFGTQRVFIHWYIHSKFQTDVISFTETPTGGAHSTAYLRR